MKKILIRICGSLCILAALLVLFLPTWITVEDVARKDIKEYRKYFQQDLENIEDQLILSISQDKFKKDMRENDLPASKSAIKNRIKETDDILDELVNADISIKEIFFLTLKAPQYIEDSENLLDTSISAKMVFDACQMVTYGDMEDIVDTASDYEPIIVAVTVFFVFFVVLGVAAAVTHSLNKVRFLKYIFLAFLILIVVGINVGALIVNDLIEEFKLLREFEDMSFKVTLMPYACLAIAIIPVILDIIFERKRTQKTEA